MSARPSLQSILMRHPKTGDYCIGCSLTNPATDDNKPNELSVSERVSGANDDKVSAEAIADKKMSRYRNVDDGKVHSS